MNVQSVDILLIEDNPGDIELVKAGFEAARVANEIRVISDGQEAIDFFELQKDLPDIVLLDINLPKANGIEVLKVLRGLPASKDLPVIILTSSEAEDDITQSYSEHANSYVSKPVDFDKFMEAIRSLEKFWLTVVKLPHSGGK